MHNNTALFLIKIAVCGAKNNLFSKSYWKLGKMNARFWKKIWNKSKTMLDSFQNFPYKYLNLTNFAWKSDSPMFSKLKSYKVDQGHSKKLLQKSLKQTVYFWRALEFWATFDTQMSKTLAIFWKKLPTNNYINRANHYKITLKCSIKKWKISAFLTALFFLKKNCWLFEFLIIQMFGQRFIIFKK